MIGKVAIHIYNIVNSLRKTAKLCDVSHTTVARWLQCIERKIYRKNGVYKSDQIVDIIKQTIKIDPCVSVRKLESKIKSTLNISVSRELVRIALKKQGFTRKKVYFYGETKDLKDKTQRFIQRRNLIR